jgi:thiazole tautomerase (transcriptional regulator TenI)
LEIYHHADFIHIREKTMSAKQIFEMVTYLAKKGVPLTKIVINDRVDVAWVTKVKGVHLAYHSLDANVVKCDFPQLTVGCSVHSLQEAIQAETKGADYLFYGHIFSTDCKRGVPPKGMNELRKIVNKLRIPIIAIGGIKPENAEIPLRAGAEGIAVMSGIFEHVNPLKAAQKYARVVKYWSGS